MPESVSTFVPALSVNHGWLTRAVALPSTYSGSTPSLHRRAAHAGPAQPGSHAQPWLDALSQSAYAPPPPYAAPASRAIGSHVPWPEQSGPGHDARSHAAPS